MTEPVEAAPHASEPDPDNRLLVDHFIHALADFSYGAYACGDFPAHDPEEGGPSEVVRDMGHAVKNVAVAYVRERAHSFTHAEPGDQIAPFVARVLENLAAEMAVTERPDVPDPLV